jgi:cytochrome c-type biogenesis protein CcmH
MGWLYAFVLGAATFGGLYFSKRCSLMALELAGAAILVALAGYGWQGSPDTAGHPVSQPAPGN